MVTFIFRAFLVLLAVVFGVTAWLAYRAYTEPLRLPAQSFAFDVRAGQSATSVARELGAAGVLAQPLALIALARLRGVDRTIKAGSYEIESGTTMPQLLAKVTQGDVMQRTFV